MRFRAATQLGSVEGRCYQTRGDRTWRVAPLLAMRLFRVPLPGNHGVVSVIAADQAHLRLHSGPGAGSLFHGSPTQMEYQVQPLLFRTLLLERMKLPLQITEARCECGSQLDKLGPHRGACPRSGRLRSSSLPIERTLARVCREAGASVRCNCRLLDMNVTVRADDERVLEVLASGSPLHHGAQLAVDITLRSALSPISQCCSCQRHWPVLAVTKRESKVSCSKGIGVTWSWLVLKLAVESGSVQLRDFPCCWQML